jgi:hypothetical protein
VVAWRDLLAQVDFRQRDRISSNTCNVSDHFLTVRRMSSRSRARLYLDSSGATRVGGAIGLRSFLIKSPDWEVSGCLPFFVEDISLFRILDVGPGESSFFHQGFGALRPLPCLGCTQAGSACSNILSVGARRARFLVGGEIKLWRTAGAGERHCLCCGWQ